MEHITQMYGSGCNYLKVTTTEYEALRAFLAPLGVELRATSYSGATGLYTLQARSALLEECTLFPQIPANVALSRAAADVSGGRWRL